MTRCGAKSSISYFLVGLTFVSVGLAGYGLGRSKTSEFNGGFPAIDASASAIGDEFSMATGTVSQDAEGVFVLDHSSGLLQCNVLYPRTGQFGAAFQANVKDALGAGKNSKYLMVTGSAQFPGGASRGTANCVLYVLDQSNGAYACFGIPFNEAAVNARQPQMGALVLMAVGQARVALDRDALR